ncbi:MAG TPA: hypothetical protein VHE30_17775 [Polyangiaceae bacterium]|nr:hypothetical protein [Polyangiaceae bacterium]
MRPFLAVARPAGAAALCLALSCSASNDAADGSSTPSGTGGVGGAWSASGGAVDFGGSSSGGASAAGGADSGGSGTSGDTGSGGATVIPADAGSSYPYDPSVSFDWPETVTQGPCLPGTYEGTFTCKLDFFAGIFVSDITGPVNFTLAESASGEFLEIKDGTLAGTANTTIKFTSPLSGKLDCSNNTFHADATAGTYSDAAFINGTFTGGLDAKLDRATQILTGTWALTPSATSTPCAGSWTATRKP